MKMHFTYHNPVIRGFHPDPSVCCADGKYYLVCSSFQYFPGVPLYESDDLVNWRQIGHVLTRRSQLPLDGANASGGIYAPTIRYHDGRFYMVTTNVSGVGNFFVWTDDIHGEWSDPVPVDQDGIDPSLYFEDNNVYFMSNHADADGTASIMQCRINPDTGAKLEESRFIWKGCGGRYLEGPHLYKIGQWYYLLAAEGGTEYGHMVVLARSETPYGPFENSPSVPIVSNRDLGGYPLQGTGHGDLVEDAFGNWWMVLLAFRQMDTYMPYHQLGRETCLIPVYFTPDGWMKAGDNGKVFIKTSVDRPCTLQKQNFPDTCTFENTQLGKEWIFLRNPIPENYALKNGSMWIRGSNISISDRDHSPSFAGIRQTEMCGKIRVTVRLPKGEAGISLYMDYDHHYDFVIYKYTKVNNDHRAGTDTTCSLSELILRRRVGDMEYSQQSMSLPPGAECVTLCIDTVSSMYHFYAVVPGSGSSDGVEDFGTAMAKYLSSEVAGGFTGVVIGLYAVDTGDSWAEFTDFSYQPER